MAQILLPAPRIVAQGLVVLWIAAAPGQAVADEDEAQAVHPTEDFVMSPAAHVAVDALIGVFRNTPKVDERVARLAAEIERTQSVVAQARSDLDADRADRARESVRQHAIRIRSIEAEFALSSGTERPNGSIEALRPRLEALLEGLERISQAGGTAETTADLDALDARLSTDLPIGDRGDSLPRPTVLQLVRPELHVPPEREENGGTDAAR